MPTQLSTTVAAPSDPTYRASEGVHRWDKEGNPASGPSTVGSMGPSRRPRPQKSEFEITIEDGITDEEGNKNSRQLIADFFLSVNGEKASEAHKKIAKKIADDLKGKIPWDKACAGSGRTESVLDFNNAMELHPDVTVMTKRPKGVSKQATDGYLLYVSVKQRNAWESIKS
jgi:hypothetical protein